MKVVVKIITMIDDKSIGQEEFKAITEYFLKYAERMIWHF